MIVPSDTLRQFLERASKSYHQQLSPSVVEYLTGPERGLTEEAIERFQLGVVVDPEPGHEQYRGCLTIPYLTPSGSVTSIRFRRMGDAGPKYMTVAGDIPRLYNTAALERGTRAICVAEGELDCIVAEMAGLPTVGVPGANSWNPIWARLLAMYDAVYVLSDDDDAGKEFVFTLAKTLDNVRNVPMTGGDVTSFFIENGTEELRRKVGVR